MMGRGLLSLEASFASVCRIQKQIIDQCNAKGKPVIVATQILETMVDHAHPTSAEVADITNAVLDGCDAVVLTGETAEGKHPLETINTC
jgi:pyruvate kinase